ncbi:MAG: Zn-ribbon domain-containing OB-fold protein [Burkholderiales bacterium]
MRKPEPRITPDNEPFYKALTERRFVLPYCNDCGKPHLPPGPVCPFCFSERVEWKQASGRGRISTWTVVHKAWFAAFADDIPYNVVQVELDEGPRLTASVVGISNEQLKIGLPVEIEYGDGIARFRLRA